MAEKIDDTTLKAIAKCRSHPSILAIASEYKNRANFQFCFERRSSNRSKMLDVSKVTQVSDIPFKIIKANENFFAKQFVFILTNH